MSTETEETSTKRKDVVYSFSSYEDSRPIVNKPADQASSKYIQKARVTRASPPKPAYDPLQFVQLKPCSLVKSAQEQLKKSETIKKCKEDKKEEPEEWQCNLDNWKSSRRKRVEHIIDRVVEVKKFEMVEHDRNRRKSKTFNEMLEERCSRRLKPLPIYDDSNNDDLTELGLSTSESSDKITSNENDISGELSNSTSASNTDLSEYTYEGAIEVYKTRISRANLPQTDHLDKYDTDDNVSSLLSKSSYHTSSNEADDQNANNEHQKALLPQDVPKIDFLKRKQLFEKEHAVTGSELETRCLSGDTISSSISVKERLSVLQSQEHDLSDPNNTQRKFPQVSFTDLKNRLEIFERDTRNATVAKNNCSNAQKSMVLTKCSKLDQTDRDVKNTLFVSDIVSDQTAVSDLSDKSSITSHVQYNAIADKKAVTDIEYNENVDSDHEDSGIHTTDVSCSVSQADDQNDELELHTSGVTNVKTGINDSYIEAEAPVLADNDEISDTTILDDALEMAFQEIDNVEGISMCNSKQEPIYQNIKDLENQSQDSELSNIDEPYYQVPKSVEPYYEVPKTKPIPLYENVDIMEPITIVSEDNESLGENAMRIQGLIKLQPPKEKPPPPPPCDIVQDTVETVVDCMNENEDYFKRINSTKRIKKEMCDKRSSFLGIESTLGDHNELIQFFTHAPSISNNSFQPEGKHFDRQIILKSGLIEYSDAAESRDSGVSEDHSRQNSDLFNVLYDDPEDLIKPKDEELKILKFNGFGDHQLGHYAQSNTSQHGIFERSVRSRKEQIHVNVQHGNIYPSAIPPAKPLRLPLHPQTVQEESFSNAHEMTTVNVSNNDCSKIRNDSFLQTEHEATYQQAFKNINSLIDLSRLEENLNESLNDVMDPINMTNDMKTIPDWNHQLFPYDASGFGSKCNSRDKNMLRQRSYTDCSPQWNVNTARQELKNNSYNQHWLIQEAEQRRVEQPNHSSHTSHIGHHKNVNRKSLPESVIQTITQRVQNLGLGSDRRWQPEMSSIQRRLDSGAAIHHSCNISNYSTENDEKVLSVSGKKKCSHCSNELGRGAAMVIESLGLLYHIECFKCCVCHTRLGDGFKGTDVRVRKYKLHCQNCFSSEDGVKFSCV